MKLLGRILVAILGGAIIGLVAPLSAYAAINEQFLSDNEIYFYDPKASGCAVGGAQISQLTGLDNRQKTYNYLVQQGFSPVQSATITAAIGIDSDYNPLYQDTSTSWPDGNFGIANFSASSGLRTQVVTTLTTSLGTSFTNYYTAKNGGSVTQANGYVPDGVPTSASDKILAGELAYLLNYLSGYDPNVSNAPGVASLQQDSGTTISTDQRLLDYLRGLTSTTQVADAWAYLYETSSDPKTLASSITTAAAKVQSAYASSNASSTACNIVGLGGLSYDQAVTLMNEYYKNRFNFSFFGKNPLWSKSGQSNQCTAFVYYFNSRFITLGTGSGNGVDVAPRLISGHSGYYKSVSTKNLQPFSVFSLGLGSATGEPGHTGVILGIQADGTVIIGQANITVIGGTGLVKSKVIGSKSDPVKGNVSVEQWKSIGDWASAMAGAGYVSPTFAAPKNAQSVLNKVSVSL